MEEHGHSPLRVHVCFIAFAVANLMDPLDSIVLIDLFGVDPISLRSLISLEFSFGMRKEKFLASLFFIFDPFGFLSQDSINLVILFCRKHMQHCIFCPY